MLPPSHLSPLSPLSPGSSVHESAAGTTSTVRWAQATISSANVLTQARAQTDRVALGLLAILATLTLVLIPLQLASWWGVVVATGLLSTTYILHRWKPGSLLTCYTIGVALALQISVLDFQTGGAYEPHLLWFLAATSLIAYRDWKCIWPATATVIVLLELSEWHHHPDTFLWTEYRQSIEPSRIGMHLLLLLLHSGICSVSSVLLYHRTIQAAKAAAELDRARRELAGELEQRTRAQRALEKAKERAETAVRVKGDFLATMSHELRTPMNGILGMSHLLAETDLVGEQREYVEAIVTSGDALLEIINDVLDYSKMEAGRLDIDPMPCDLRRVCEAVMDILAPKADEKNLAFVLRYRPEVPRRVVADAARIRQVLLNLVGNALKFTPSGRVVLDVSMVTDERIRLAVRDTGIGMNILQQAQLFQPFMQADAGTTRTYGGTGLGLAISKRLIELMNGTVGVTSEPERGSVFWCELPLMRDESLATERTISGISGHTVAVIDGDVERREAVVEMLTAAGLTVDNAAVLPSSLHGLLAVLIDDRVPLAAETLDRWAATDPSVMRIFLTSLSITATSAPRREPLAGEIHIRKPIRADTILEALVPGGTRRLQPRTSLPQRIVTPLPTLGSVLLVDDNYVSLRAAEELLQNLGYTVITAVDGVQALQRAGEVRFNLIILDVQLADMTVENILSALRGGTGPSSWTRVIGLSATSSPDAMGRLRQIGIEECMTKPVTSAALADVVKRSIQ
jgi:signal transduction histidine kinase/CheY-like chemotaxis protein